MKILRCKIYFCIGLSIWLGEMFYLLFSTPSMNETSEKRDTRSHHSQLIIDWNNGIIDSSDDYDQNGTNGKHVCRINTKDLFEHQALNTTDPEMQHLVNLFLDTQMGGRWTPTGCTAAKRIAIIIAFRDRHKHLRMLLNNLIPKLRRQKVDYTFYIIEQETGSRFNRGMLKNIGFVEARRRAKYDCYIFHDVDSVTESDYNFYTCKDGYIYHIAPRLQRDTYKLTYPSFIGTIVSYTAELFQKANGYTNFLFVWGGEDDDLWRRVTVNGGIVERPFGKRGRVSSFEHMRDKAFEDRFQMLKEIIPFAEKDGLNSLHYSVVKTEEQRMFTLVKVQINETFYRQMLSEYKQDLSLNSLRRNNGAGQDPSPPCVMDSSILKGREEVNLHDYGYETLESLYKDTEPGGEWKPTECAMYSQTAIIIPFRNQHEQLRILLNNLIPKLRRQNVHYRIYVVEQNEGSRFNQGLLKNIGVLESFKDTLYDCFIFHDVDTVIESDFNNYRCELESILHMSPKMNEENETLIFSTNIGGVTKFMRFGFLNFNGFSNFYFDSRLDNDDMYRRVNETTSHGLFVGYTDYISAYHTKLSNNQTPETKESIEVFNSIFPFVHKDGLNSVHYDTIDIRKMKLFTWISVSVNEQHYKKLLRRYHYEYGIMNVYN